MVLGAVLHARERSGGRRWLASPPVAALPARPQRIILHWTGGTGKASAFEREHYHYLVQQDGLIVDGIPVALNMRTCGPGVPYAAHTRGFNSFSVGVSFCGMLGAKQGGPFGNYPLTEPQVEAGCAFIARLCATWGLAPTEAQVFTHAEGSAHADVEWIAFDKHNDLAVIEDMETLLTRDVVQRQFGAVVKHDRAFFERIGLLHDVRDVGGGKMRGMLNTTRAQMLSFGAIRQVGGKAERLKSVIRDLLVLNPLLNGRDVALAALEA